MPICFACSDNNHLDCVSGACQCPECILETPKHRIQVDNYDLTDGSKVYKVQIFDSRSEHWISLECIDKAAALDVYEILTQSVIDAEIV